MLGDHLVAHDVCEDEEEAEVNIHCPNDPTNPTYSTKPTDPVAPTKPPQLVQVVCTALYEKLQAANEAASVIFPVLIIFYF